jgi:uncharacterized protein YjbI with pentapeptide repeats
MTFWMIVAVTVGILVLSVGPGLYFWWPTRSEPACRSDLGVALMTGALIAFAVLGIQVVVDKRLRDVEEDRRVAQERQALKLQLALQPKLIGIPLAGEKLQGVYLYDKDLTKADLRRADLTGAVLTKSDLTDAKLQDAILVDADLNDTTLTDAKLHRANMENAILANAPMVGAKVNQARLRKAELGGANLRWADLTGAKLQNASLSLADLRGADLTGAVFDGNTEIEGAKYDRYTTWPAGHKQKPCRKAVCEAV